MCPSIALVPSGIAGPASAKGDIPRPGRGRPRRRRGARFRGELPAAAEVADAAPATALRPKGPCCAVAPLPRLSGSGSLERCDSGLPDCPWFVNAEVSDNRRVLPDLLKLSSQVGAARDSGFDPMVSNELASTLPRKGWVAGRIAAPGSRRSRKTVGLAKRSSDRRGRAHCSQSSLAAQIDGAARLRLDCWRLLSRKACQGGAALWRPFRGGRFSCRAACGAWTRALGSSRSGRRGVSV